MKKTNYSANQIQSGHETTTNHNNLYKFKRKCMCTNNEQKKERKIVRFAISTNQKVHTNTILTSLVD